LRTGGFTGFTALDHFQLLSLPGFMSSCGIFFIVAKVESVGFHRDGLLKKTIRNGGFNKENVETMTIWI
jgi:hypothetical protein